MPFPNEISLLIGGVRKRVKKMNVRWWLKPLLWNHKLVRYARQSSDPPKKCLPPLATLLGLLQQRLYIPHSRKNLRVALSISLRPALWPRKGWGLENQLLGSRGSDSKGNKVWDGSKMLPLFHKSERTIPGKVRFSYSHLSINYCKHKGACFCHNIARIFTKSRVSFYKHVWVQQSIIECSYTSCVCIGVQGRHVYRHPSRWAYTHTVLQILVCI